MANIGKEGKTQISISKDLANILKGRMKVGETYDDVISSMIQENKNLGGM